MLTRIDLKRELKPLFRATRVPGWLNVPALNYLTVTGSGAPAGSEFQRAVQALYTAAYTLKFTLKKSGTMDYAVMPLEALWWIPGRETFDQKHPETWHWKLMMVVPDEVSEDMVEEPLKRAQEKKPELAEALARVRFERFEEGRCAQVLHVGPYAAEGPVIEALHHFIAAAELAPGGKHHEIYLSDPRRTAPSRLKTIIRSGVKGA
jgi:hypothetical protein